MHHLPLALTLGAVTLAGSVWYLPALQTLRAGQDRPHTARLGAAACLTWWGSGPVAGVALLFMPARAAAALLALGAVTATALRLRAAQVRRREQRAQERLWAELGETASLPDPAWHRPAVLAWTLMAVAAVVLTAAVLFAAGSTTAAALVGTGLVAAATAAVGALTIQQHTARAAAHPRADAPTLAQPTTIHPALWRRQAR